MFFHVFPLFPVVIEAPTHQYTIDNPQVSQWYVTMGLIIYININLSPSPIDSDNIFWTFTPTNNNSLSNAVSITEAPETASYTLSMDHLSLSIFSPSPNEEGNYTITVLDNLVTSTKTISLNILRKQFVSCV